MNTPWMPGRAGPSEAASIERVRASLQAELGRRRPGRGWRADVGLLLGATALVTVLVAVITRATGSWAIDSVGERARTLALLASVQLAGAYAAIAPRAKKLQIATVALSLVSMGALVLLRGRGAPSALPEWVCSGGHVGMALGPVAVAVLLLRRSAPNPWRALAAGAGIGAIGAVAGELACGQDARHVALFHLPAWLVAIGLTFFVSRRLRPLSYAP